MDFKSILKKASFDFFFKAMQSVQSVIFFMNSYLAFPFRMNKMFLILLLLFSFESTVFAQANDADFLRSTGMIYCVIAVIAVVIIGLALYLMRLEKKINKLEKKYNNG